MKTVGLINWKSDTWKCNEKQVANFYIKIPFLTNFFRYEKKNDFNYGLNQLKRYLERNQMKLPSNYSQLNCHLFRVKSDFFAICHIKKVRVNLSKIRLAFLQFYSSDFLALWVNIREEKNPLHHFQKSHIVSFIK